MAVQSHIPGRVAGPGGDPVRPPDGPHPVLRRDVERFSYYGMRALLVLYMTKGCGPNDRGSPKCTASTRASSISTPLLGGYARRQVLGRRKAVVIGGLLMAARAHLADVAAGDAPSPSACSSSATASSSRTSRRWSAGSTREGDPRDGGFTIFYMGINLGALLAARVRHAGERPTAGTTASARRPSGCSSASPSSLRPPD